MSSRRVPEMDIYGSQDTGLTKMGIIFGFQAIGIWRRAQAYFGRPVGGVSKGAGIAGTQAIGDLTLDSTVGSIMASAIMDRGSLAADGKAEISTIIPPSGELTLPSSTILMLIGQ
jgi:hypothetical protein